mmetsp:Transcript_53497/g.61775  ORF Transcript_53497/g.61775 Transcript_53497/m.61775 type:complete len:116 (+) Transcript_53497:256-603(+)
MTLIFVHSIVMIESSPLSFFDKMSDDALDEGFIRWRGRGGTSQVNRVEWTPFSKREESCAVPAIHACLVYNTGGCHVAGEKEEKVMHASSLEIQPIVKNVCRGSRKGDECMRLKQ